MHSDSADNWTQAQANNALAAFETFQLTSPQYDYRHRLAAHSIRLLKVSMPEPPDPIPRLVVVERSLEDAPPFEAMSYCWGDYNQPMFKAPITTETNEGESYWVPVTKSLAEMLAYLPRHCLTSDRPTSYIWVDQICINQAKEPNHEKADQIKLMGQIYSQAEQVIIWLGPGPDPAAVERISALIEGSHESLELGLELLQESQSAEDKEAMKTVWKNAWFERSWVVQEVCLAKKHQAAIGLFPVHWEFIALLLGFQYLVSSMAAKSDDDFVSSAIVSQYAARSMWSDFEEVSDGCDVSRGILLCSFLARFGQHFKTGDERDKILAYVSLWKPESFDISSTAGESSNQVYTRLAVSLVKDTKRLDVLAALRSGPRPVGEGSAGASHQPSWVPRWDSVSWPSPMMAPTYSRQLNHPKSIITYLERRGRSPPHQYWTTPLPTPSTIAWKASSPHNNHIYVASDTLTLRTRGKIICRVETVLPLIQHHPVSQDGLEQFQSSLRFEEYSITLQEAIAILIECTVMGRPNNFAGMDPLFELQQLVNNIEPGQIALEDALEEIREASSMQINIYDSYERRFFITTSIKGIATQHGLGPGWTDAGDEIAILHGARFPVILRKVDKKDSQLRYQVVGDCYITNIMKGEAVYWEEDQADDILLV